VTLEYSQTEFYIVCSIAAVVLIAFIWQLFSHANARKKLGAATSNQQNTQATMDSISSGVLILNDTHNIVYCNAAAAKLLGRKKENLLAYPFLQLWCAESRKIVDAHTTAATSAATVELSGFEHVLQSQASQLALAVTVKQHVNTVGPSPSDQHQLIVTISNVQALYSDLAKSVDSNALLERCLQTLDIERFSVDIKKATFSIANSQLHLFGIEYPLVDNVGVSTSAKQHVDTADTVNTEIQIESMLNYVAKSDHAIWKKFARDLKETQTKEAITVDVRFVDNLESDYRLLRFYCFYTNDIQPQWRCFVADVSAEYALKNTLEISELKFHSLISMSPEPVYLLDQYGCLQYCNGAFERLFGIRGGQNIGKPLDQLYLFPDALAKMHISIAQTQDKPSLSRTVRINQTITYDLSQPNLSLSSSGYDGHNQNNPALKRLHVIAQSIKGSDANVALTFGFVKDLTEIFDAKNELIKAQKHFQTIVDLAPVAIATIDDDDHLVSANTTMLARLGLAEKELNKGNFYELFNDPSSSGKIAKELHKTGRVRNFFAHLKGKNKELHPSEIHIDLFDKDKQEYLCWITDKSAEQFQQDRFENLLEHSSIPMAVLGDFGFCDVNPAAMRFFKTPDEKALHHMHPYAPELNGDDAEHLKHIIAQVKATGQAQALAWQHIVKQQILPCHLTLVPMYKGKEFDSILCVWIDLSELKQADAERQQALELQKKAQESAQTAQAALEYSQSLLASKERTLAETNSQLSSIQHDLDEQQTEYRSLKAEHLSVTEDLNTLQSDYQLSRSQLDKAKVENNELTTQLKSSTQMVKALEAQRQKISDALSDSQDNYSKTKQALLKSEERTQTLEQSKQAYFDQMQQYKQQMQEMQDSIQDKDTQIELVAQKIHDLQNQLADSDEVQQRLADQLSKQRDASIEAEKHKRILERNVLQAKSALDNKEADLQHIQSEMQKLEEMSNQQKGDMQALQQKLEAELSAKQAQLVDTRVALQATAKEAENERVEKQKQQAHAQRISEELRQIEAAAEQKQREVEKIEQQRKDLALEMQRALDAKQEQIQAAEQVLSEAKQQTAAEKAEKLKREDRLKVLQDEVKELAHASQSKLDDFELKEQQGRALQMQQASEVAAKKQQLTQTQAKLEAMQQQAENERIARLAQQQKVEQLTKELSDVQVRADKQKQMLAGNDEQWRQHHAEIEKQKEAFQSALEQAQAQNQKLEAQLSGNLEDLQQAEHKVSATQSDEQKLRDELNTLREQGAKLTDKLVAQESKELSLQAQVQAQQNELKGAEHSIETLQQQQVELSQQLKQVQDEYENSKSDMHSQQQSQHDLSQKLAALESELDSSKTQLKDKEQALQSAKQQIESNQLGIIEQEKVLLQAREDELKEARQSSDKNAPNAANHEIMRLAMPTNPKNWFDLLPYLQRQSDVQSLPIALQQLIDEMQLLIASTDEAINADNRAKMLTSARQLVALSVNVNAEGLSDAVSNMQNDNPQVLLDTISIAWPNIKKALQNTLRVIYSNLVG